MYYVRMRVSMYVLMYVCMYACLQVHICTMHTYMLQDICMYGFRGKPGHLMNLSWSRIGWMHSFASQATSSHRCLRWIGHVLGQSFSDVTWSVCARRLFTSGTEGPDRAARNRAPVAGQSTTGQSTTGQSDLDCA